MKNLIYSENTIIKLINEDHKKIISLYILKINKKVMYIAEKAKNLKIHIVYVRNIKNEKLAYVRKYNSIICKIINHDIINKNLEEIINDKNTNRILILDRLQDPYNFAACVRTAEAFNFKTIITNEKNCVKNSSLIVKISNGASLSTNIICENNLTKNIELLKKYNFKIIGLSSKTKNILEKEITPPIAIIMGSEKNGINKKIIKLCNAIYKINTKNTNKSINVSVATGIVLSKIKD